MSEETILPVLLCGGAGTRLWPASTASVPKPFLPLIDGRTLFDATLERVSDPAVFGDPVVVTGCEHRHLAETLAREAGRPATLILEPAAMGTAAAIAAASTWVAERDPARILLFLAADHVIRDVAGFRRTMDAARSVAAAGRVVLFGVPPSGPDAGLGYIRPGPTLADAPNASAVAGFVEKPNAERAKRLVDEGCLWNSGDFMMRADTAMTEIARHATATAIAVSDAVRQADTDDNTIVLAESPFRAAEPVSFDRAVAEKTDRAAVVVAEFDWTDAGTWSSVWAVSDRQPADNATSGAPLLVDTEGSLVRSDGPLVGVLGMRDVVVVAANGSVLVAPRERAGEVRRLASIAENPHLRKRHVRPWGAFETLDSGPTHQVKRLIVNPGARLSLQRHVRRSEHWTVVQGRADVTLDGAVHRLSENQSIFLPRGAAHRVGNPGRTPTVIIETQYGDYFGEDDIVRLADDYGRARRTETIGG